MNVMHTRKRLLPATAALLVLFAVPTLLLANHSWGGYHWARTQNPLTLQVGNNMTGAWQSYYSVMMTDWNKSTVLNLLAVAGSSNKRCGAVSGTVQVCNGSYGNNGWLGLAQIWLARGTKHITQGTAKMNDSYFNTSTYNNPNEKQHVVCQEVGHTFGLDHQDTSGADLNTCMDYFSNTGQNATSTDSTHPNAGDYDELLCIYDDTQAGKTLSSPPHSCTGTGHLDSTTTAAAKTAAGAARPQGNESDSDDPNSWGQLVRQSANGRASTYERYNADGSNVVTFVTWTLDAAERCPSCDHRYDH